MMAAAEERELTLEQALVPQRLTVLFQPILDLTGASRSIHAVECLLRGPSGTAFEPPAELFRQAREQGLIAWADRVAVAAALAAARHLEGPDLGVNVHAATLAADPEFLNFLGDTASIHGIEMRRLIVDVTGLEPRWEGAVLYESLSSLRSIGARVALDEIGSGGASYRSVLESHPDYLKVDACLVRNCHCDPRRQAALRAVATLAEGIGARVVAEWVERFEDLDTLVELGVSLVQGHLFFPARPAREVPPVIRPELPE